MSTDWLCCLTRTTKVLCSNLGATRHIMTLDKSLAAVCFGSSGRYIGITFDMHRPLCLVCGHSVCTRSSALGRRALYTERRSIYITYLLKTKVLMKEIFQHFFHKFPHRLYVVVDYT
jgi:hypothetical protein